MAARTKHRKTPGQKYEIVGVDKIKPHPKNPNKGDVGAIAESIRENDWYGAVTVQKSTGYILAGEHRWRAAKREGMEVLPVIYVDADTTRAMKIMLADNAVARLAEVDEQKERAVLEQLSAQTGSDEAAVIGTGYDKKDLVALRSYRTKIERAKREFDTIYAINVICRSEKHQEEIYDRLSEVEEDWGIKDIKVVVA